jgi:hypothetical protein
MRFALAIAKNSNKYFSSKIQTFVAKSGGTHVYSKLNRGTSNGQTPA